MSSDHDPDDLLVLGRRGALSEADERRLRDTLSHSVEAQWLHEAGLGFDTEAPIVAGDHVRIERIAKRAQARVRTGSTTRWLRVARAAVGGVLAAGIAVGAVQVSRTLSEPAGHDDTAVEKPSAPPAKNVTRKAARTPASETVQPEDPPAPPAPLPAATTPLPGREESARTTVRKPEARVAAEAPAPPAPPVEGDRSPPTASFTEAQQAAPRTPPNDDTAAAAFSAANRARIRGDVAAAVALYERLQRDFPSSVEAGASNITLGLLCLQQGRAGAALAAFQRSKAAAGGAVSAEALWGEARALAQLGRVSDERSVLEELLRRHPNSAYDTAARKRLAGLE